MKKIVLIIAISLTYILSYALPLKKAEVISDGDRGLALEWVKEFDGGIEDITTDNDGNIYTLGCVDGNLADDYINNKLIYYVTKHNHSGKLLWLKEITSDLNGNSEVLMDYGCKISHINKNLFLTITSINENVYFDKKSIYNNIEKKYKTHLLEIDSQNGVLLNSECLYGFSNEPPSFHIHNGDSKVLIGVISDGEYIANGYWREDGTGIPFQKFEGMNQTTMKTETRTHGATDYYFAKLDEDNNLVWDFALGGKRPDYTTDSIQLMRTSLNDDTLFVYMAFFNDSIDIDPDPNHEVWVYGQEWYWGWPNFGIVLIKYDISGNKPILLGYKEHENTWFIDHNYIFSKKSKGTFMAVENPLYRIVIDGEIIHKASEPRVYATVGEDCSITIKDSIPATSGLSLQSPVVYSYDNLDNLYVPRNRVHSSRIDTLPIVLNFTMDHKEYVYDETETWHACVSKFNNNGEYLWSLMLRNVDAQKLCHDGEKGYLCLHGFVFSKGDYTTDFDPNEGKSYIPKSDKNRFLLLYRETYRISSDPTEHGEVTVPDTFAWHGRDYEIGIMPDEGYHLEKLTANGEEIKADADGKYYVKNVKEPICINAKFAVGAGINDSKVDNIEITPNLVEKILLLEGFDGFISYSITDVSGRVMKEGPFEESVDVSCLISGRYQVILKGKDSSKIGTFIKK